VSTSVPIVIGYGKSERRQCIIRSDCADPTLAVVPAHETEAEVVIDPLEKQETLDG
jgi:hypothetical protein